MSASMDERCTPHSGRPLRRPACGLRLPGDLRRAVSGGGPTSFRCAGPSYRPENWMVHTCSHPGPFPGRQRKGLWQSRCHTRSLRSVRMVRSPLFRQVRDAPPTAVNLALERATGRVTQHRHPGFWARSTGARLPIIPHPAEPASVASCRSAIASIFTTLAQRTCGGFGPVWTRPTDPGYAP